MKGSEKVSNSYTSYKCAETLDLVARPGFHKVFHSSNRRQYPHGGETNKEDIEINRRIGVKLDNTIVRPVKRSMVPIMYDIQ